MHTAYLSELDAYIRCHDLPGGDPVRVYLHGVAVAAAPFYAHVVTQPPLTGHRSVLVDLLGHGYSDRPAGFSYAAEDHASSVIRLLDELGVRACELVGHSMGGSIAIVIAGRRPDLVSRLVIAEGNLDPGSGFFSGLVLDFTEADYVRHGYAEIFASLREQARESPDEWTTVFTGTYQAAAPWAIHRTARSIVDTQDPTFREQLLRLALPRALIIGAKSLAELGGTDSLVESGIPRFVVPDAGHGMAWDNPDGFARAIDEALRAT